MPPARAVLSWTSPALSNLLPIAVTISHLFCSSLGATAQYRQSYTTEDRPWGDLLLV
jgi:hypothetical protein